MAIEVKEEWLAATNRELLAEGEYEFEITDAEEAVSRAGNEMIKISCKVDAKIPRFINDYLVGSEKAFWKVKSLCCSVGIENMQPGMVLEPSDLVGKRGVCVIAIEQDEYDGNNFERNTINDYLVKDKPPVEKKQSRKRKPVDMPEDDIPF